MEKNELFFKTVFCCMSCDGDIAPEEVELIRNVSKTDDTFKGLDVQTLLDKWVKEINNKGKLFLKTYLNELSATELSKDEQLKIVDLAIKVIEADNIIKYSEVSFFKKIRSSLSVSDEAILKIHPDKEDFLLPDIMIKDDPIWAGDLHFDNIILNNIKLQDVSET